MKKDKQAAKFLTVQTANVLDSVVRIALRAGHTLWKMVLTRKLFGKSVATLSVTDCLNKLITSVPFVRVQKEFARFICVKVLYDDFKAEKFSPSLVVPMWITIGIQSSFHTWNIMVSKILMSKLSNLKIITLVACLLIMRGWLPLCEIHCTDNQIYRNHHFSLFRHNFQQI